MTRKTVKNGFRMLSPEEGRKLFDQLTRRHFQMSGEDFLRAWKDGEIDPDKIDDPEAERVFMMMPLAT